MPLELRMQLSIQVCHTSTEWGSYPGDRETVTLNSSLVQAVHRKSPLGHKILSKEDTF